MLGWVAGASLLDVLRKLCMSCTLAASYVIGVDFMAWSESASGAKWVQKLANGSTASGGVATVNVSMGALDPAAWDVSKAGAIINAIEPVFSKSLYRSIRSVDYSIESDE